MSAAPDWIEATRVDRGLDRLIGHCALMSRMTTATPARSPARERLERELGPELTQRLVRGLSSASA
jgi:hypothetical protein